MKHHLNQHLFSSFSASDNIDKQVNAADAQYVIKIVRQDSSSIIQYGFLH
jgi:hypothetical protein